MPTVHIEHAISDYATWKAAFDRFAEARQQAGSTGHRIRRPVDDPQYVVVDLEFPTTDQAASFLAFLRRNVWSSRDASPGLAGDPQGIVLVDEEA